MEPVSFTLFTAFMTVGVLCLLYSFTEKGMTHENDHGKWMTHECIFGYRCKKHTKVKVYVYVLCLLG